MVFPLRTPLTLWLAFLVGLAAQLVGDGAPDGQVDAAAIRVYEKPGEPAPAGLSVELFDPAQPATAVASGTVGSDGLARFDVPRRFREQRLHVRLRADGWCETSKSLRYSERSGRWETALEARRGWTLHGRLVDASGRGVPGRVQLAARYIGSRLGGGVASRADADGRFTLDVTDRLYLDGRGGAPVLIARAPGYGTGVDRGFDASGRRTDAARSGELVVRIAGSGSLRGRVVDAGGRAIPGLGVHARSAALGPFDSNPEPLEAYLERDGIARASTLTAEDGSFEIKGLSGDAFWIAAENDEAPPWERRFDLLRPRPVASNGDGLVLSHDRPTFALRLEHADGSPWVEPIDFNDRSSFTGRRGPGGWPAHPYVRVRFDGPDGSERVGRRTAGGLLVFPWTDRRDVFVELHGGHDPEDSFAPRTVLHRHSQRTDGGNLTVQMRAAAREADGRLTFEGTVTERDIDGSPLEDTLALGTSLALRFQLTDVRTGVRVIDQNRFFPPTPEDGFRLPPGTYRWRFEPDMWTEIHAARAGGAEGLVRVVGGQRKVVRVDIGPGATVRPTVTGARDASLWLERPDGSRLALTWSSYPRPTNVWSSTTRTESRVVPSGDYTLIARVGGSAEERRIPIELAPGERLDVEFGP
ncbi:MAG: carboxypeptidase-like regulatory domain-containing protein [Planctomycetota bacterium]